MDTLVPHDAPPLIGPQDPAPLRVVNPEGAAPFLLVCEHAGNAIPAALGDLGLDEEERRRHIAWDIGAIGVAERLSQALDAPLFVQPYSRLVIDCNRPWETPALVPAVSDGTPIPGNAGLSETLRLQRWHEIHQPFHAAIAAALDAGPRRALLTVHSFTPVLRSQPQQARPMQLGLLFGSDSRLADALQAALAQTDPGLHVARNQPYAVDGPSDYAIPVHGLARGIPNLLLEIRNDQILTEDGQAEWARRLAAALARIPVAPLLEESR